MRGKKKTQKRAGVRKAPSRATRVMVGPTQEPKRVDPCKIRSQVDRANEEWPKPPLQHHLIEKETKKNPRKGPGVGAMNSMATMVDTDPSQR